MFSLLVALVVAQVPADSGFITIRSNVPGIAVYLESEYIGRTPIERSAHRPGSYILSIASNDSIEQLYARLRTGSVGKRLPAVWSLVGVDAGTQRVTIRSGQVTDVFVDYAAVLSAPSRAKWLTGCAVGGIFGIGAVIGLVIGLLVG